MLNLGDQVRDEISDFMGIAVARHIYLNGCNRISVQSPIDKDNKLPDIETFDEPGLEVIRARKVVGKTEDDRPGGPEKYSDTGKISD